MRIPVHDLITNLRKMLAAKFFFSSHNEDHKVAWSQNPKMYKTQQLLQELGQTRFPVTLFFTLVELCSCATCVTFYSPVTYFTIYIYIWVHVWMYMCCKTHVLCTYWFVISPTQLWWTKPCPPTIKHYFFGGLGSLWNFLSFNSQ